MLSLMTLFSQSIASCPRLKSVRTRPRTTENGDADDRQHGEYAQRQPPVDGDEQHARPDDQEDRRDERGDHHRDEHLHGVDVRRQGPSAAGVTC